MMKRGLTSHKGERHLTSAVFYVSLALLALFSVAQIHEVIPFLHQAEGAGDAPGVFCPFCVVKYALALALWIAPLLLLGGELTAPPFVRNASNLPSLIPGRPVSRGPPASLLSR